MPEEDASYKQATKAVDDAMRMDVLGPKVLEAVEKYTPVSDAIEALAEKAVKNNSDVRDEINLIIDGRLTNRKGKGVERVVWQAIATVVGIVVAFIMGKYFFK